MVPATSTKAAAPPSPAARHTSPVTLVRMEMAAVFSTGSTRVLSSPARPASRPMASTTEPRAPAASISIQHPAASTSTSAASGAPRRITAAHSTAVTARAAICMIPSITGGTGS